MNLSDAELIIMNLLWSNKELKASEIARIMMDEKDWKKNTTYTLINRLEKKGAIERIEPGFICKPLLEQQKTQLEETKRLINKIYNGSFKMLVQNFIDKEDLSSEEIQELKMMISEAEKK